MSDENEEAPPERRWTLAEVERQEEGLKATEQRILGLEADEKRLSGEIATGLADGREVSDLQAQRAEARTLREDLTAAVVILRERIDERRELALHSMAEDRVAEIRRQLGGNAGEHAHRLERLGKALAILVEEAAKIDAAYRLQQSLQDEAAALSDRFDLKLEPMKSILPPARDGRILGLLNPTVPTLRLVDRRPASQKPSAPTGPGAAILKLAGARPPRTPEEVAAEAAKRAREEREAEQRRREEAEVRRMEAMASALRQGSYGGIR